VLSVVEGWLQSIEKKMKLWKVWKREKYVSWTQHLIKDPVFVIPELAAIATGGYFIFRPSNPIFGEPPLPTDMK
jgi:hypothetical protein